MGVFISRVDLTGDNVAGRAKLKELGWVGIPLLAIAGPGRPEPTLYGDGYTVDLVLTAIAAARPRD